MATSRCFTNKGEKIDKNVIKASFLRHKKSFKYPASLDSLFVIIGSSHSNYRGATSLHNLISIHKNRNVRSIYQLSCKNSSFESRRYSDALSLKKQTLDFSETQNKISHSTYLRIDVINIIGGESIITTIIAVI